MMWLLGLMHIMLSLGDVDALIPIIIILILIAAAGGLTRGFDIFSLFGLGTLAGIGLGSKGSMASRKTGAYDKSNSQYKEGFVSGSNEGNTHLPVGREGVLTKSDKFKAMGSIRGAKYGNTPKSSSLIAGAYHSYYALSGKAKAGTSNPSRDLIPGPNVLTKGAAIDSSPLVISKAAAIGAMTVKQMNDHIANRVRMAVLNPEKYGPKKRTVEQPSYPGKPNTLPFSSTDNAVGWLLSGRSGAALKTSRMRQLAANDPAAFRKEYNKIVRRELYRHMVNNKMIEHGSSFRMPSDKERMTIRYSRNIYNERAKAIRRNKTYKANLPPTFNVKMPGVKISKNFNEINGSVLGKKFNIKKKEKK